MYLPVIDPTLPGPDPSRIEQAAWRSRGRTRHLDPMLARLALSRGALFRSLKCGLAAALAWAAATTFEIHGPLLAPLVAMLTVEVTVWQSVSSSMQRVVGLLVGVMAALGLAGTVGLHAWTIGVVVTGTLLMGYALRLRDRAGEAAATALIVMGVAGGSAGVAAQDRVFASLMGAAAGVLVSLIVIPTTEVGPAGRALNRFSDGVLGLLRNVADVLEGTSEVEPDSWSTRVRQVESRNREAWNAADRAEDTLRLNPRGRLRKPVLRRYERALERHARVWLHVRVLVRTVGLTGSPAQGLEPDGESQPLLRDLALLVDATADAIAADVAPLRGPQAPDSPETGPMDRLDDATERLHALLDALEGDHGLDVSTVRLIRKILVSVEGILMDLAPRFGATPATAALAR